METTLEEVAEAADEVAADQRRIAREARALDRDRRRGLSWTKILDQRPAPGLIDLLRRSNRRLADATSRFTRGLAEDLRTEGESRRQIARRLGVSHQRVSALLDRGRAPDTSRS